MQVRDVESIIEERRLKSILEGCPVAADDAVVGDDGLENATVVVGTMTMLSLPRYQFFSDTFSPPVAEADTSCFWFGHCYTIPLNTPCRILFP